MTLKVTDNQYGWLF